MSYTPPAFNAVNFNASVAPHPLRAFNDLVFDPVAGNAIIDGLVLITVSSGSVLRRAAIAPALTQFQVIPASPSSYQLSVRGSTTLQVLPASATQYQINDGGRGQLHAQSAFDPHKGGEVQLFLSAGAFAPLREFNARIAVTAQFIGAAVAASPLNDTFTAVAEPRGATFWGAEPNPQVTSFAILTGAATFLEEPAALVSAVAHTPRTASLEGDLPTAVLSSVTFYVGEATHITADAPLLAAEATMTPTPWMDGDIEGALLSAAIRPPVSRHIAGLRHVR